jgi:hypothetical protein
MPVTTPVELESIGFKQLEEGQNLKKMLVFRLAGETLMEFVVRNVTLPDVIKLHLCILWLHRAVLVDARRARMKS